MDIEKTLEKILEQYVREYRASQKVKAIERKIEKGIFRYSEADMLAQESGEILTRAFAKYLPEVLTNGRLYRETAEVVLKNPMLQSRKDVRDTTVRIQRGINEAAGIGMNPVEPEVNMDQINGIITGICNARSYEDGKEVLFDQIENFLEGTVDDFVQANADFQYQAGLDPVVIRTADGKCCAWCSKLAGTYKYEDVRDKGNDVWRRHRNCHCTVEYDPGKKGGGKTRVSGPRSTDPGKADRIAKSENAVPLDLQMFAHKTGDYRRAMYGSEWQEASLEGAKRRFTKGAKGTLSKDKQKKEYRSKDGRYLIKYDIKGDYFRVIDQTITNTGRQYVGLNGEEIVNVKENGKKESVDPDEYNRRTHFINTDKRGR